MPDGSRSTLSRHTVWVMAMACGVTVANGYYNQPLLAQIARNLALTIQQVGFMPMTSQLGIALGVFLILPLGDSVKNRRLMLVLLSANTCALVAVAMAPNQLWLLATSLAVGFTTVVPYLIPPLVARLASPQERGKTVGVVTSGIFIGVLFARTASGLVGASFGWRTMYFIASSLMVILAIVLFRFLPESQTSSRIPYGQLMKSLWSLFTRQPILRQITVVQSLLFGSFNVFWTTLVFLLETPPYHYGSRVAGLFGLVGIVGATAAPLVGCIADRKGPRLAVGMAIAITLASWCIFYLFGEQLVGLIIGVILLDLGAQAGHVSNQALLYSLLPEARSRLNTVYTVIGFLSGALSSAAATYCWSLWQWKGVSTLGLLMVCLAGATYSYSGNCKSHQEEP